MSAEKNHFFDGHIASEREAIRQFFEIENLSNNATQEEKEEEKEDDEEKGHSK